MLNNKEIEFKLEENNEKLKNFYKSHQESPNTWSEGEIQEWRILVSNRTLLGALLLEDDEQDDE